jgi:hypothetical protein
LAIEETKAPGQILHDNLDRSNPFLKGASDGSLFRDREVMTAGWILANNTEHMTAAVFVISPVSSLSSSKLSSRALSDYSSTLNTLDLCPTRSNTGVTTKAQ